MVYQCLQKKIGYRQIIKKAYVDFLQRMDDPYSMYPKFSEELKLPVINNYVCESRGRDDSLSKNLTYVLIG